MMEDIMAPKPMERFSDFSEKSKFEEFVLKFKFPNFESLLLQQFSLDYFVTWNNKHTKGLNSIEDFLSIFAVELS